MATFKAEVRNKRADGTYNVRIRVTHNREVKRLSTKLFVTDEDLTRTLKIKNTKVLEDADDIIRKCRQACTRYGFALDAMTADEVVGMLKRNLKGQQRFTLDFIQYMKDRAGEMKKSTGDTYVTVINSLLRYIGRASLDISEINTAFLRDFEKFIATEPSQRGNNRKGKKDAQGKGGRAVSKYLGCIRAMHNQAKKDYNDEDRGVINIPYSPFKNYQVKAQPKTRKRALTVKQVQTIINLPYKPGARWNLAKDCFILSFALIGMNSADMYYAGPIKDGILTYNRYKTKDRRDDKAEMRVKVPDCISLLLDKYKGRKQLFNFNKTHSDHIIFNRAINLGLKQIGAEIGIDDLEFYAARHSWATIARSAELNIDKATVHEALNHVDNEMKVTDIYINKDWSVIWNANERVLSLFDWSAIGYDLL